jgi:hypothetical protein
MLTSDIMLVTVIPSIRSEPLLVTSESLALITNSYARYGISAVSTPMAHEIVVISAFITPCL